MSKLKPQLIVTGSGKKKGSFASGVGYFVLLILVFVLGVYVGMRVDSSDLHLERDGNKEFSGDKQPSIQNSSEKSQEAVAKAERGPVSESKLQNSSLESKSPYYQGIKENQLEGASSGTRDSEGNVIPSEDKSTLTDASELNIKNGNEISLLPPGSKEPSGAFEDSYRLQVAAYADTTTANEVVEELKVKGYAAYIVITTNSRGEVWNLIKIGDFKTAQEAWNFSDVFRSKEGGEAFVESLNHGRVHKRNLEEPSPDQ